jgi:hypothetical protein
MHNPLVSVAGNVAKTIIRSLVECSCFIIRSSEDTFNVMNKSAAILYLNEIYENTRSMKDLLHFKTIKYPRVGGRAEKEC